ncbi:hypothetical protein ACIQGZ_20020 [Streptomyces sp. NPDC092296]|uniref:hypothetical protein n=1 Tax=Streptomyces sp. NPDC092296 TaxID=3366012 RepID=UPI0037F5E2C1
MPTLTAYWGEVIAEGAPYSLPGRVVRIVLGERTAANRRLALRWLRGQAHRIADGLDPGPAGIVGTCVNRTPNGLPDVPQQLRDWCTDDDRQAAALAQLTRGEPVALDMADHTGRYYLAVWPICIPVTLSDLLTTARAAV